MFGYIRLFSIVSFIAVLFIAVLVGFYFKSQSKDDVIALGEKTNIAVAGAYGETTWKHYGAELAFSVNGAEITASPSFASLRQESEPFFTHSQIVSATVYNGAGIQLYTKQPFHTNADLPNIAQDIANLRKSSKRATSELVYKETAQGERALVRSIITLNASEGFLDVYTDITPQWEKLSLMQWIASGGIITVCAILIWILMITSKKAEAIITKQHEANTELAATAAAAQAENREKSLFLANISHELRTPLNAIIGFSEIIKNEIMGQVENQRYNDYISDIYNSGVHLLSLINDILDFSKAEAGKLELEVSEVNANKTVVNCLRLIQPRAESSQVTLVEAMPKEAFVIQTDSKKFKQVLLNLLSNAVKFTPQGGEVRVAAWRNVEDDSFTFEVKDSGIGIAAKDIAKAMSAFGQVDNTLSRKYDGTGLGLPLTKKFVELMGGHFNIESEQGKGTTITFTLPREFRPTGAVPVKMML